ncbi:MAG TPA: hypothetical protein VMW30_05310 [Candidatus Paceibacterota bacterium]|nr:hypothetical protein [Candidatus Paceibacterota bacterium]
MVAPRPLRLKSQVGTSGKPTVAIKLPVARVWVDSGVFHLDSPFDYWVPETLSSVALPGVRVQVEFGNSIHEAIIVERIESSPSAGNLKALLKVLSPHPVATSDSLSLISLVARRWAGMPYDVVRSAIPPRVASVDKEPISLPQEFALPAVERGDIPLELFAKEVRAFWSLPPSLNVSQLLSRLIVNRVAHGQVLVVAPDERQLIRIEVDLLLLLPRESVVRLDGHLSRADRYRNYLKVVSGSSRVALGLRGSIFAPLQPGSTIIVLGETSELLYEPRTPGWNVRDVALMRANESKESLIFLGFSPSLELARLIETGWITHISSKRRRAVTAASQTHGELLPSKVFPIVRNALISGPVLFLVPRKGYGNAVLCNKCRNISLCECGGRLEQKAAGRDPQCVLCQKQFPSWHCAWCQDTLIYIASRGIDRFAEEIGTAFPNNQIINSSGDHIVDHIPHQPALVVATPGSQPSTPAGYSAVALLEGTRFLGHTDLRSAETAREHFFETASLVSESGIIFLALDQGHPMVASLTRWDATAMVRKELQDREELKFPPYYRYISLETNSREATSLLAGLETARREERIPSQTELSGPHARENERSRILISAPFSLAPTVVGFLHELQRRRSISHKPLFTMRVDPYSLTH